MLIKLDIPGEFFDLPLGTNHETPVHLYEMTIMEAIMLNLRTFPNGASQGSQG